jgi:hypothetical protein
MKTRPGKAACCCQDVVCRKKEREPREEKGKREKKKKREKNKFEKIFNSDFLGGGGDKTKRQFKAFAKKIFFPKNRPNFN